MTIRRRGLLVLVLAALFSAAAALFSSSVVLAAETGGAAGTSDAAPAARDAAEARARREEMLRTLESRIRDSDESRRRLTDELAGLRADGDRLAAALVGAAERARTTEDRIADLTGRYDAASAAELTLRRSLEARRGVTGRVLAALQRMGRRPPPAIVVEPGDILAAIRASTLLGALVPGLEGEIRALMADLRQVAQLRAAMAVDRDALALELEGLAREQARLTALTAVRQERLAATEDRLAAERSRADALGRDAKSLKDLVDRLGEQAAANAKRSAEDAGRTGQPAKDRFAAAAARDPARLSPRLTFLEARGTMVRPASGSVIREFGADDGGGGTLRGIAIATRRRAVVTSPADGAVVFSGPFRSFGRLLIISGGEGYYVLLAGLGSSSVGTGQSVLAGEPVGQMGEEISAPPVAGVVSPDGPVLYVELRKDGASIDPGPWWAKSLTQKVRG